MNYNRHVVMKTFLIQLIKTEWSVSELLELKSSQQITFDIVICKYIYIYLLQRVPKNNICTTAAIVLLTQIP